MSFDPVPALRAFPAPWFLAAALTACGSGAEPAATESTEASVVARQVFDRAYDILSEVDYLPFQFKLDGCYARALYMSMELANERIESNSLYAFASPQAPLQVGEVEWSYHVAPMLQVQVGQSEPIAMVIDPGLSDEPLTAYEWLSIMTGPFEALRPEETPEVLVVPGSRYSPEAAIREVTWLNRDVPNFEALPPFELEHIQEACGVMFAYLGLEGSTRAEEKREALLARTESLIAGLRAVGKLSEAGEFSARECAETEVNPWLFW